MPDGDEPRFAEVFGDSLFTEDKASGPPIGQPSLAPDQVFADTTDDTVGVHVEGVRRPRFDGDTSELPAEVCWTLQELVAAPHVSEGKSKKHWPVVLQYEETLRSRLSELGLVLEINREHRYAFARQADDPSPQSRAILRSKTLSLAASTLALYLYQQFLLFPDDPVVEFADMLDHMTAYKRASDTDDAAFERKTRAAIKALDDAALIKPIKGTSRYVIHAVITSLLTADQVDWLRHRYEAIARGEALQAVEDEREDEDNA